MARCNVCGNDYDKTFEVQYAGRSYTFDCLECAAEKIAPRCSQCGCRMLGHGLEQEGEFFCCAHCARAKGKRDVRDRVDARA
jgi:hypothetical protein